MDYVNIYTPYDQHAKKHELESDWIAAWVYDENKGGWVCNKCGCKNNNLTESSNYSPNVRVGSNFCPNCGRAMSEDGQSIVAERLGLGSDEGV